ncbi:transcriptional activator domain-containing protein [Gemmatirosa kalamazoonensis]|uniref:Transcriptional activator domain-containing protein n=1 Tax=Gemmatirosa kalamazoonensis TaxID=861299 RepID=W0RGE2_9BACT|nr:BTAD domain-containing putative transcriptional regulator [Gemmatirosa kalamazoonensis]AHG89400.1 transcriptional activator domain-containing protein [Gemmatirosa kalamazoonensis]
MVGADGEPLTGAAGQRRNLAFLSVLAVAGDDGLTRDKITGLLWPDVDADRARHSLTQALYAARRAVGVDDLFVVGGDIRLNRSRITSDVQELESALDEGDLERAVGLYRGPFLDGFFLPSAPEFEQWSSAQRARLEDRITGALERLAQKAESAEDFRAAVEWRKQLAAIRPLDSATAVGLMTALARSGDRARAIHHARLHEELLRDQLGLEPDPVVTALAERLREPVVWQASALAWDSIDGEALDVAEPEPSEPLALEEEEPASPGTAIVRGSPVRVVPAEPARNRAHRWMAFAALAVILVIVAVALSVRRRGPAADVVVAVPLRQKVVIAPFRVSGASETLSYLREGLVELLSTRLADDSAARSVDAGAVLGAWQTAGLGRSGDVPRDTVVKLASRLGAERVVIGSVVGTRNHVVISATVVGVATGAVVGQASVEGPADSVTTLVDRLAARLLVEEAGEDVSVADRTTASLPALRAFLAGQAAFRRADYVAARRSYERALQRDSMFALAALQLVRAGDRLQSSVERRRMLAIAWQEMGALGERDRTLLVALVGPRYPAPSPSAEQVAAWERVVSLTPDRADAWYELGARLFRVGAVVGLPDAPARAIAALQRALAIDSTHASARTLLAQLAAGAPPNVGPLSPFARWLAAAQRADSSALRHLRDTMPRLGGANLRAMVQAAQFDAVGLADARRALQLLQSRAVSPIERLDALEAEHALALNEGRRRDALDATRRLQELQPGSRAELRLRVLDALYGDGDPAAAEQAVAALDGVAPLSAQPGVRAAQVADRCVLAQWRLSRRDTTGVSAMIGELRAEPAVPGIPIATTPAVCATLLDATLAVVRGGFDAHVALAALDSLALTPEVSGDASAYAPILVARLHERLGDVAGALASVQRRAYMAGWPRYLATALREEGRYAESLREPDVARRAYERFLALRVAPDSSLAGEVEAVRRAAQRP